MSFNAIDPTTPAGNEKVKFGDDRIREFKAQTIANFQEISNYPATSKPALRTAVWTMASRPTGAELVDRVSGYNTDLGCEEYFDQANTKWVTVGQMKFWTTAGRPAAPFTGQHGYNTDLAVYEAWNGTVWVRTSGNPAGKVELFAMSTPPTGWLKCNGQAVSRTTYAELYAVIGTTYGTGDGLNTFTLPDLRGEFLRGWDDGRGIDNGRTFGSAQADAFQGHGHNFTSGKSRSWSDENVSGLDAFYNVNAFTTATFVRGAVTDGTNGTPRTAAETRPRNIALLYCIKA